MDKIDELLTRGVDTIYPSKEEFEKVLRSGKKLKIYQGFDPTGDQLHIGHMAGLMKLKQFQDLGHHIIFLIGDGTGQAGDPSGKLKTREVKLKQDELRNNAKDYVLQASKIVRFDGENAAEIKYNGDWLNKLTLPDILDIADHVSWQQLAERDLFQQRIKSGESLKLREALYPLLQGYDSVAMEVDGEIGGSDQTFNMLMGRQLVKDYLHKEKYVMTTRLLTDSEGRKIGKTEGNVIALTADPQNLYGMIMSLSDDVIVKCFESITSIPMEQVKEIEQAIKNGENPMKYKKQLAFQLVNDLHSEKDATIAQDNFEKTVQGREVPEEMPEIEITDHTLSLIELLIKTGSSQSKSEAKRLIEQGGVEVDGVKITDANTPVDIKTGTILKVGKRNYRKIVKNNNS